MKTLCNIAVMRRSSIPQENQGSSTGMCEKSCDHWVAVSVRILVAIHGREDELRIESDVPKNVEMGGCKVLGRW